MIDIINEKKKYFKTNVTKNINFRINALSKFKSTILKYENEILDALKYDLNRSYFASYSAEIDPLLDELDYFLRNTEKLSKVKKIKTPKTMLGAISFELQVPRGLCLIVSPWNYPFLTSLVPLVGAIASGNCVIMKPSEHNKKSTPLIKKIIDESFDKSHCEMVLGEKDIVESIINTGVDFIFFTGSVYVGKIIMELASKNLTPICLELGGKNPCIVDESADIDISAKRILWGKTLNSGQTCIAPDYILIKDGIKDEFIKSMIKYSKQFFGKNPVDNDNYPKMINKNHFNRAINLLNNLDIIHGGAYNKDNLKIEPTFIDNPPFNSDIMTNEIFAPLLPIISYNNIDEIYDIIDKNENPLALYIFSKNSDIIKNIINNISFGNCCINDTIMQIANHNISFGGVGSSGMGRYHKKHTFDTFSATKSIMKASTSFDSKLRYPNYENLNVYKKIKRFLK